jgi:ribosomal protein S18 acetylase RimI-like enzyme
MSSNQILPQILLEVYDSANWLHNDDRWLGSKETFIGLLKNNDVLLAYDNFSVIGFLSFIKQSSEFTVITGLYVSKEHQSKGVADSLMSYFNDNIGITPVYAEIVDNAIWAVKFYSKHNFIVVEKDFIFPDKLKMIIHRAKGTTLWVRYS